MTLDLQKIFPRLKQVGSPFAEGTDAQSLRFEGILAGQFLPGIAVVLLYDEGTHYRYLTECDLAVLSLSDTELDTIARDNLHRKLKQSMRVATLEFGVSLLVGPGDHGGTAPLVPEFLEAMGFTTDDCAVSVPTRDICAWGLAADERIVSYLAGKAAQVPAQSPQSALISDKLIVYDENSHHHFSYLDKKGL